MIWSQHTVKLKPLARGVHPVTDLVVQAVVELARVRIGLLHVFVQHTSASLSINENADPDVPIDLAAALDRLAPESAHYQHTCEGPDDMPAHVKTTLTGTGLTIPVTAGRLALGTWQGIFLCEHRNRATARTLVATLWGTP